MQRLGDQALLVHGHVRDLALERAEHPERPDVAGRLAEHDVARVAEDAGDQVERLLRADGDGDVVGVRGDALQAHHLADRLADLLLALPGPVLHRLQPAVLHEVCRVEPTTSRGRSAMFGMPPASETTSGRLATAKSARMAEAVMPCVRAA